MSAPTESEVSALKASLPGRELHAIELGEEDDKITFIVTAPNKDEWKKFRKEAAAAKEDEEAQVMAMERAALAQIRWPDRDEVRKIFDRRPAMVVNLQPEFNKLAGLHMEARTKKL